MTDITTIIIVAVVVIVLVAIAAVALTVMRRRRSAALREQFGPEYDRTMRGADDPRDAEKDLAQRRRRHRSLRLRDLDPQERAGYRGRWTQVQQGFVDDPATAVREADRLVAEVMSARGYPVEDFDQQAEDLSVAYPVLTQRYREARGISREHAAGRAGTEDLRHAVTSYRSLVDALLDDTGGDHDRATPAAADPRAGHTDPRHADPWAAHADPRNGQVDPRAAQADPRTGRTDPRGIPVDPGVGRPGPAGPPPQHPQTGRDTRRETSA